MNQYRRTICLALIVVLPTIGVGCRPPADNRATPPIKNTEQIFVVAQGLDTPWALVFLPDNSLLVTERKGTVRLINADGKIQEQPAAQIASVREIGEGGLHGIALHPDFGVNKFVYLYYTYSGSEGNTLNRVVRTIFNDNKLTDEKIIVDTIPGASNHDGGRIKFGPDKLLYISTGDANNPSAAQDTNSLAGKILRVKDDGRAADGNPFNNQVFSYGHRNPQGIAWDAGGTMWATEHGPSGAETGHDELNKIEAGKNYGWPEIRGKQAREGMISPVLESGSDTWAPAGLAFVDGELFFGGLRGQALYQATVSDNPELKALFKEQFGRIREVVAGPDGMLYVTTSNRDGRGSPRTGDDKILRINLEKF